MTEEKSTPILLDPERDRRFTGAGEQLLLLDYTSAVDQGNKRMNGAGFPPKILYAQPPAG